MLRIFFRALLPFALLVAPAAQGAAQRAPQETEVLSLPPIVQDEVELLNLDQLKARSAKGDLKAQAELGARYARGAGVPADMAKAVPLFEQAAKKGGANAQYYLAQAYDLGAGVKQDKAQAAHWFGKAAAQNHAGGQYSLGIMMTDGQGGLKADPKAAAAMVRKAANQGYLPAAYRLSQLYIAGLGVERNPEMAAHWLRRILKGGIHPPAAASLEVLIQTGEVAWRAGDPGSAAIAAQPNPAESPLPPRSNKPLVEQKTAGAAVTPAFKPADGPNTIDIFKDSGVTIEVRYRDGYMGVFTTSANPYDCAVTVNFTRSVKETGERIPGDFVCFKNKRPAGNQILACESEHANFLKTKVDRAQLEFCEQPPK